jgi:hypothetical protein
MAVFNEPPDGARRRLTRDEARRIAADIAKLPENGLFRPRVTI